MPNVEVNLKDMQKLVGKKLSLEQMKEAVLYAKGEVDAVEGDTLTVDIKDTNRPDLLSAEGIAREIRGRVAKGKGVPEYKVKKSGVKFFVDKNVQPIRPKIAAAIVKNVKVSENFLIQMIQLQEKIHLTFGRKRREAAIGLYDWSKLEQPMHYRAYKPGEKRFIPLEYNVEMDLEEILEDHPKGRDYAHLLEGQKLYPILEDNRGVVASMPPIINSQLTGKVSGDTKEVLVEVTGYRQETVNTALNVMVSALAERGFGVYSVEIVYPKGKIVTPNFAPKKASLSLAEINRISGLGLGKKQAIELLGRGCYNALAKGDKIEVEYPAYRQDILHPVDIIEDIIISYGFDKIEPTPVSVPTVGAESKGAKTAKIVRETCVGIGLQEVLTFTMTSKERQTSKIGLDLEKEQFVEIANPVSENYAVFRKRVFPELLEFLSKNKHCLYPQKVFEFGKTLELDKGSETGVVEKDRLCIVLSGKGAGFNTIKGVLDAVTENLGIEYSLKESDLAFLEKGRQAEITAVGKKGFLGEVSEKAKQSFGLEQGTVVLELEI